MMPVGASPEPVNASQHFDNHADTYDADLNSALSVSGEDRHYFAEKRVSWVLRSLQRLGERPRFALDYGCGVGDTSVLLHRILGSERVLGLDVSRKSLQLAALRHASSHCQFLEFHDYVPAAEADLAYCNGVFHHIPVAARSETLDYIKRSLRPGGLFALWENNPWNPGTRYVMSRCAFDRDAIVIQPREAVRLLQGAGFEIVSLEFLFFFPRFLKALRFLEPHLARVPLGAQYQVLCQKPA